MVFPRQWWLVWLVLFFSTGPGWAGSTREQRAYDAAISAFHDGLWPLAEMDFAQFAQKYPESKRLPQAALFQVQAMLKQGRFDQAQAFLKTSRPLLVGPLAYDYIYWLGEAQLQSGDWPAAVTTLTSLPAGSPHALNGAVEAAAALAQHGQWSQLTNLLQRQAALLHTVELTDPGNDLVLRARLLKAQAASAGGDFRTAAGLLSQFKPKTLPADLEWQRLYLSCQVKLAADDPEGSLPLAMELVPAARLITSGNVPARLGASVALQSQILEALGQTTEAMAALQANLVAITPPELQRAAILKIAALAIAQHQFTNAEVMLTDYASRFTNSPALDAAWVTLGGLYLQDFAVQPNLTNQLADARLYFELLLTNFPQSSFTGKAWLGHGWCDWLAGNWSASLAGFEKATLNLPPSEDLLVARFKLADAQFASGNYAAALGNYQMILSFPTNEFPRVVESLANQALYQSFRAQLQLQDLGAAEQTMKRLASGYPPSPLTGSNTLLLGEACTDMGKPTNALAMFKTFKDQLPHSTLLPAVDLAMARAYSESQRWPEALAQYEHWLLAYPKHELLPQVMYAQAWANYQAGNPTNALRLFTNFVARFPNQELAPTAQWWVADYFFGLGDWEKAERNYKAIFQNPNWQTNLLFNGLCYQAQMMAGRAAVFRTDNAGAIRDYFEKLESDTNCPQDLRVQATFAHGSALMKMDSADTNDPTANFQKAVGVFNTICTSFPTNELGARAWGEMGDCYLQLTNYDGATNAYTQAWNAAGTNISLASQARLGLGLVLEKQAALIPAEGPKALESRNALYYQALGYYREIFFDAEPELDPFWRKKSGLQAAALAEALGEWPQAVKIYASLMAQLPQLKESLTKKAALAAQHLPPQP